MASGDQGSSWKHGCHFLLCGCVVGFFVVLAMLVVHGRREPTAGLRGLGPCHPLEDASAPLPLCRKSHNSTRKSQKLDGNHSSLNASAIDEELEKRQERVAKAQMELEARDEADREHQGKGKSQELLEAERQHKELLEREQRLIDKRERSSFGSLKDVIVAPKEVEKDSDSKPSARNETAKSQHDEEEEEVPCHTAVKGETCFKHVVWSMQEGFHEHPEWYPGLSPKSSFAEFQYVMNLTGSESQHCPMPCLAKKEHPETAGCRNASPGEDCYKQVLWAKTHGIYEHPEWYNELSNESSFEAFQEFLRTDRQADCPTPCSPSLQLLLH